MFTVENAAHNSTRLKAKSNGVELYASGTKRLDVTTAGAVITGSCTATSFAGVGSSLTALSASSLQGALPAISGANLTNLPAATPAGSNEEIQFNNSNSLGATSDLTYKSNSKRLCTPHLEFNDSFSKIYSTGNDLRIRLGSSATETINMSTSEVTLLSGGSGRASATAAGFSISGTTYAVMYDRANSDFRFGGNIASWGTSNQFVLSMPPSQSDSFIDCKNVGGSLKIRTSNSSALDTNAVTISSTGVISGDGSGLTNLPASGGTVDLQADATAISTGKPVNVNSSGKLVEVAGSQSAITPVSPVKPNSVQTWSTASNNASYMGNVNEDANAINQTVITSGNKNYIINVWNNGSQNNYGYYVVGEQWTTGDPWSISWGTVTAFASYTRNEPPAIAKLGNTYRVVMVTASSNGSYDYWKFYGGTLNIYSKLITFNSGQTAQELLNPAPDNSYIYTSNIAVAGSWETRPYSYSMDAIEKNNDFCFVSLHCHDNWARIFQVQWDGSNFGISDPGHLGSLYASKASRLKMAYKTENPAVRNGVTTTGWIAASMNDNQNKQMFMIVDSPPNNLTFASQQTDTHNDSSGDEIDGNSVQVFWMDDTHAHTVNQFLSFFFVSGSKYYGTGSTAGPAKIFTLHLMTSFVGNPAFKTDITASNIDVLNAGTCMYWDVHSSRFILQYYKTSTYKIYVRTATLKVASGQTVRYDLDLGAEVEQTKPADVTAISNNVPIRFARQVPINEVDNSYYIQSCWCGDSNYSNMAWLQYSQPTESSHTGATYIGITTSFIGANTTGTVSLAGSVNTQVSGLTVGSAYYLGSGGVLSTTPATPTTKVGVALTSSSILLTP